MTPENLEKIKADIIKSMYDLSSDLGELPMSKRSHGQATQICHQYANQISEYLDNQLSAKAINGKKEPVRDE